MIDRSRTRISRTYEMDVLSTDSITEAGLALTGVLEGGKQKARRSNAVDNTIFLGFSWGDYLGVSSTFPKTLTTKFGAANSGGAGFVKAPLPNLATGTADMTVVLGTGFGGTPLTLSADATPAVTEFYLTPDGLSILSENANAGLDVFVSFRYSPSLNEMTLSFGDTFYPTAAAQLKRIGVIANGEVWTSNYNTAIDWSAVDTLATAEVLRAGANGRFTVNTAGALCRNTFLISVPSAGDPYLGLRIEN